MGKTHRATFASGALAFAATTACVALVCAALFGCHGRERRPVSSWALYYGGAAEDIVQRLSGYDLVVIDANALGEGARATVAALKGAGCRVIAYLSAVEVASWHRYRDRVDDSWYIRVGGDYWSPWGGSSVSWAANRAASLAEPGWRGLLLDLVASEALDYGCDGVFFDTLEDLDFVSLPAEEAARQREGLREFMSALREKYPDALFVANRTLQAALDAVAPFVDGVCWESFRPAYFRDENTRRWMDDVAAHISAANAAAIRSGRGFQVLSLYNEDKKTDDFPAQAEEMREISARFGYVPYCVNGPYSTPPPQASRRPSGAR